MVVGTRASFATVGLWWAVFAVPIFILVRERRNSVTLPDGKNYVSLGFSTLFKTLRRIGDFKEMVKFLIAFLIYNDGVQTVIAMATIYGATELKLGDGTLIGTLLMIQFVGIPGSIFFGWLAKKIGAKRTLLITLTIWSGVVIYAFFMRGAAEFWILGVMVGLVMGGSQAISRSLYGLFVPREHSAEFFGFYAISNKFSSILGPLMFGLIGDLTGNIRNSILFLVTFFIVGMIILGTVDVKRGREAARITIVPDT